ncbi:MAG: helix-hairpin-helix domain-containing protein [Myxococcota bacterium]|nr:helix-hairpin-helix domain-containing protein [Myxococcota bacterium]
MTRTGWLGIVLLVLATAGAAVRWSWPSPVASLQCPEGEEVRYLPAPGGGELAACAAPEVGRPPPAGAQLTLGRKLDLNTANEAELALLPGVGPSLARALVARRDELGGFADWDQVDEVPGVGAAKLETLQGFGQLGTFDAGGAPAGL